MKKIVYLVLKQAPQANRALEQIRSKGYNATVMATESLRHLMEEPLEDRHFFSLRHVEQMTLQESVLCMFLVDDDRLDSLKEAIRAATDHFRSIKGFFYVQTLEDYEGSI